MTSLIVGGLVALVAVVGLGLAWRRDQRRRAHEEAARRPEESLGPLQALLTDHADPDAPLLGEHVDPAEVTAASGGEAASTSMIGAATAGAASAGAASASAMPGRPGPDHLVDRMALWVRRRDASRKGTSIAIGALVLLAIGILAYPLLTDMYSHRLQNHLRKELSSGPKQSYAVGDALTRIKIPSLNVDVVVVQGTTTSALRAGAGHYVVTPLPCALGNVGIAGHRTTYGKPFHDLQKLNVGDTIVLQTPAGSCSYHVNKPPFSVKPSDVQVLDADPANPSTLTLTTCDPPGSAAKRLIIQATLDPTQSTTGSGQPATGSGQSTTDSGQLSPGSP